MPSVDSETRTVFLRAIFEGLQQSLPATLRKIIADRDRRGEGATEQFLAYIEKFLPTDKPLDRVAIQPIIERLLGQLQSMVGSPLLGGSADNSERKLSAILAAVRTLGGLGRAISDSAAVGIASQAYHGADGASAFDDLAATMSGHPSNPIARVPANEPFPKGRKWRRVSRAISTIAKWTALPYESLERRGLMLYVLGWQRLGISTTAGRRAFIDDKILFHVDFSLQKSPFMDLPANCLPMGGKVGTRELLAGLFHAPFGNDLLYPAFGSAGEIAVSPPDTTEAYPPVDSPVRLTDQLRTAIVKADRLFNPKRFASFLSAAQLIFVCLDMPTTAARQILLARNVDLERLKFSFWIAPGPHLPTSLSDGTRAYWLWRQLRHELQTLAWGWLYRCHGRDDYYSKIPQEIRDKPLMNRSSDGRVLGLRVLLTPLDVRNTILANWSDFEKPFASAGLGSDPTKATKWLEELQCITPRLTLIDHSPVSPAECATIEKSLTLVRGMNSSMGNSHMSQWFA